MPEIVVRFGKCLDGPGVREEDEYVIIGCGRPSDERRENTDDSVYYILVVIITARGEWLSVSRDEVEHNVRPIRGCLDNVEVAMTEKCPIFVYHVGRHCCCSEDDLHAVFEEHGG